MKRSDDKRKNGQKVSQFFGARFALTMPLSSSTKWATVHAATQGTENTNFETQTQILEHSFHIFLVFFFKKSLSNFYVDAFCRKFTSRPEKKPVDKSVEFCSFPTAY